MQSSESSSSPKPKASETSRRELVRSIVIAAVVWMLRFVVGGVFILSGVSKAIDVWGVYYKIEEYAILWGFTNMPHALLVMAAMLLSVWEALLGFMLLLGCYRRSMPWLLIATMAVMLPLSLYIYIYNPVADCGCFGDFIKLSNPATFYKNIAITAMLVVLAIYNRRVAGLITPYLQWIAGFVVIVYLLLVILDGYTEQPLVDFRGYPVGTSLAADAEGEESGDEDVVFEFVYEKDGVKQTFDADNLPDSTWQFVDRRLVSGDIDNSDRFCLYDRGEDVTADVIMPQGEQMLLLIPDLSRAGISYTSYLNALNRYLVSRDGVMTGVIATDDEGLEQWRDLSLADYDLYTAESTAIKELARGDVALVYLRDGVIQWKRNTASLDGEELMKLMDEGAALDSLEVDGPDRFHRLTGYLGIVLAALIFAASIKRLVSHLLSRRSKSE